MLSKQGGVEKFFQPDYSPPMRKNGLPIPVARIAMQMAPPAVLSRGIDILMRKMERRHPRLFRNLERLDKAVVHIEPTDLPHRFALSIGRKPISLEIIEGKAKKPSASMKGDLRVLIDMLEGRIDGDMVFFSRDFVISGDTSVIVGLRNTLDRENINLLDDMASVFGPFAEPLKKAVFVLEHIAAHVMDRFMKAHRD